MLKNKWYGLIMAITMWMEDNIRMDVYANLRKKKRRIGGNQHDKII